MRNLWTIAKREFNMYFASPIAYVVAFVFLLILGYIFMADLISAAQFGGPPQATGSLGLFVTLVLFMSPALTMRLFSEEQRSGTLELLLTAPVREWELVLGKWLAAFGFLALILFSTGIYVLILNQYTSPGLDFGELLAAYVGLLLMVSSLLALGVFVSSLFSNQIAAFFVTLSAQLILWIVGALVQNQPGAWAEFVNYLVFSSHYFDNFYRGQFDVTDFTYFVSLSALFLFLATQMVESRRWR
jgi:ABC-2 type transport system permease protein